MLAELAILIKVDKSITYKLLFITVYQNGRETPKQSTILRFSF